MLHIGILSRSFAIILYSPVFSSFSMKSSSTFGLLMSFHICFSVFIGVFLGYTWFYVLLNVILFYVIYV
jgi:hypothetical protein